MTPPPANRPSRVLLAFLTGLLALADGALAALGLMIWNAHRHGHLTTSEAATFALLGASAAVGALLSLLALTAFARGARGHGTARFASGLAWLRSLCVIIALAAIATAFGTSAIIGQFETFGAAVALVDTVFALIVTGVATRRTRHE